MTQNKSVEKENSKNLPYWWEDYKRAVAPSNGEDKEDVPSLIHRLIQQERQTSQEREREIVDEILKRLNKYDASLWKAEDWTFFVNLKKEYNITLTNPNKD